jgi:hypothetical protein
MPDKIPALSRSEEVERHWSMLDVPSKLDPAAERKLLADDNRTLWLRCVVRVPASWSKEGVTLTLPKREPLDTVWFNGKQVPEFRDRVPAEAVVPGEANLIVVRRGRLKGNDPNYRRGLMFAPILSHGDDSITLAGKWRFRIGDDESWSNMPLPARFGAATDYIIEPAKK